MLPYPTEKQKETLQAIESFLSQNSMPPTLAELQTLLKVSSNQAVINHLEGLEKKGYIERKKTARGIRLLKSLNESEDVGFLELLFKLAAQRKSKQKAKEKKSGFIEPTPHDSNSEDIIFGAYNDERY